MSPPLHRDHTAHPPPPPLALSRFLTRSSPAHSNSVIGEWSQAGCMLAITCGGPWFAEIPQDQWPESEATRKGIMRDFKAPFGDRRQVSVLRPQ